MTVLEVAANGFATISIVLAGHNSVRTDSAVLVLSLLAQLLLFRRPIATWALWSSVETIAVPLYASRGLQPTAVLFAAHRVKAGYGAWRWRREMRRC